VISGELGPQRGLLNVRSWPFSKGLHALKADVQATAIGESGNVTVGPVYFA
jgi:hypothetical protein